MIKLNKKWKMVDFSKFNFSIESVVEDVNNGFEPEVDVEKLSKKALIVVLGRLIQLNRARKLTKGVLNHV